MPAHEAISILMQIVDQITIEAVLSNDVNGTCRDQMQSSIKKEQKEALTLRTNELSKSLDNQWAPFMSFILMFGVQRRECVPEAGLTQP